MALRVLPICVFPQRVNKLCANGQATAFCYRVSNLAGLLTETCHLHKHLQKHGKRLLH